MSSFENLSSNLSGKPSKSQSRTKSRSRSRSGSKPRDKRHDRQSRPKSRSKSKDRERDRQAAYIVDSNKTKEENKETKVSEQDNPEDIAKLERTRADLVNQIQRLIEKQNEQYLYKCLLDIQSDADIDEFETEIENENVWLDANFPHNQTSIGHISTAKEIQGWRRIPNIYKDFEMLLFGKRISADDMCQGRLDNSYLISSMSSLASESNFIRRLFSENTTNFFNHYPVYLFDSGEWKTIEVNDFVPCAHNVPNFCRKGLGDNMWALLLEKACAKMYGSYSHIEGGNLAEALNVLTGAPTKVFEKNKYSSKKNTAVVDPLVRKRDMWNFIKSNKNEGFFLIASTPESALDMISSAVDTTLPAKRQTLALELLRKSLDIYANEVEVSLKHVYSVLEIKESENGKDKILKLRDPRGENGLSDRLMAKSQQLVVSLGGSVDDYGHLKRSGCFWMTYDDFYDKFERIVSCKAKGDFQNHSVVLTQTKTSNFSFVKMLVQKEGLVHITAYQRSERHFKEKRNYRYSNIRVLVAEILPDETLRYVKGKIGVRQQTTIFGNFTPGNYLILVEVDWNQQVHNKIVVDAYTNVEVQLEQHNNPEYNEIVAFYKRFIKAYIVSNGIRPDKPITDKYNNKEVARNVRSYSLLKFGLWIQYYINEEKEAIFNLAIKFESSNNRKMLYPPGDTDSLGLALEPGFEEMFIHKITPKIVGANHGRKLHTEYSCNAKSTYYFKYSMRELVDLCEKYGERKLWNEIETFSLEYMQGRAHLIHNKSSTAVIISQLLDGENVEIQTSRGKKEIGDQLSEVVAVNELFFITFVRDRPNEESRFPSEQHILSWNSA